MLLICLLKMGPDNSEKRLEMEGASTLPPSEVLISGVAASSVFAEMSQI